MKILLYENPEEHRSPNGSVRSIKSLVEEAVLEASKRNVLESVVSIEEAERVLSREDTDAVVVHWTEKPDVDELKEKYPKPKYISYTGAFNPNSPPRSDGEAMLKSLFWQNYDYYLDAIAWDLPPILLGIAAEKQSRGETQK